MRNQWRGMLALAVCLAVASPAMAQGQRPGGGRGQGGFGGAFGMMGGGPQLLGSEQVQKELKLSDEQKEKIGAILKEAGEKAQAAFGAGGGFGGAGGGQNLSDEERQKQREEMQKRFAEMQKTSAEYNKKAEALLNADQAKRLKQISLWVRGTSVLMDAEVAKELKLAEDQVAQIKTINEEANKQRRELFAGGGFGGGQNLSEEERQKNREKMTQLQKDTDEELLAVLTDDQKASLDKMKGEKFELDRSQFGGPGGGRGGRPGGRPGRPQGGGNNQN